LGGMSWEVEIRSEVTLRFAKGKWRDNANTVVAEEKVQHEEHDCLTIVGPNLEVYMKDLIVAAWATRIWQGNGRVSLARTLIRGEGSFREAILPFWKRPKRDHVQRRTIAALSTPFGMRRARPFEMLLLRR